MTLRLRALGDLLRRARRDERGASAVEFALLLPAYLFFLCGMMAYAVYFGAVHSIQQIAADAARAAVAGLSEAERDALVAAHITSNAGEYALIRADRVVHVAGDRLDAPGQYRISVSYDASALPIWNLYVPLPLPERVITRVSTIRHGGV